MVARPQVAPTEASAFEASLPRPPRRRRRRAASSGDAPGARASAFGGESEFAPAPPAPESRYVGPPTALRVLTVAGVAVNEGTTQAPLLEARAFEAHAFDVAGRIASAGGAPAKRLDPPTASTSDADGFDALSEPDFFRANALVYEREGVWTRFYAFEARLVAAAAAAMAVTSETPSTKVVDGRAIPGARSGAVGGHAAGSARAGARGARDARASRKRARAPTPRTGAARPAQIKAWTSRSPRPRRRRRGRATPRRPADRRRRVGAPRDARGLLRRGGPGRRRRRRVVRRGRRRGVKTRESGGPVSLGVRNTTALADLRINLTLVH